MNPDQAAETAASKVFLMSYDEIKNECKKRNVYPGSCIHAMRRALVRSLTEEYMRAGNEH